MSARLHRHAVALSLIVGSYALAFWQRPGWATSDTKIDLHVDPVGFLADAASAWSSTGDVGHVQGGQYGGYLLPMGPFFAALHALGVQPWAAHRLWLGTLFALAALGGVRLLVAMTGRRPGAAALLCGALMVLNPYVVTFTGRTSVTLLAYAALPWLLLAVHRGVRTHGWWWPAAFALVLTLAGGGVNVAVTVWVVLAPVLLAGYERVWGGVGTAAIWHFAWRTALLGALTSAWWVIPVLVQVRWGVDFLALTESPGAIWATTSLSESLRLMGYWISYVGVGYGGTLRPYLGSAPPMLFSAPVVFAGLLVPACILAAARWTSRERYGPFFLLMAIFGLVAMAAGFPEGTPLRRAMYVLYDAVTPAQALRTTYKAGPLLAVSLAVLAGLAVGPVSVRLRAWPGWLRGTVVAGTAVLVGAAAWPLVAGHAIDRQLAWRTIPAWWQSAADHVDRVTAADGRGLVLPGQLYASYDWGTTVDHILPSLARSPVASRFSLAYTDPRATDLLWTTDALVGQRRAVPGQLGRLTDWLGARTVLASADDDRTRSGTALASQTAPVLDDLGRPSASWGPARAERAAAGTLAHPVALARVRAWDRPSPLPRVRLVSDRAPVIVDGSAAGLASMAAFGALPRDRPVRFAADLSAAQLRDAARTGDIVVTDSARRQSTVTSRTAQTTGPVLAADEELPRQAATINPFVTRGTDAQTVATYEGVARLRAPVSPFFSQFPERRPFAAFDGDRQTAWVPDRQLPRAQHWLEVTFTRPRAVGVIEVLAAEPQPATALEVAGRRYGLKAGWNRLPVGLRDVSTVRLLMRDPVADDDRPVRVTALREVRIAGLRVREALRPPVLAQQSVRGGRPGAASWTYVLTRTTGDDPFARGRADQTPLIGTPSDRRDPEAGIERVLEPPMATAWTVDGWATVAPTASDAALDRLVGGTSGVWATSSSRLFGRPGWRASSALDGDRQTAWIAGWHQRRAWISWSTPAATRLGALRLQPVRDAVRRPTLVRLRWRDRTRSRAGVTRPIAVDGAGRVAMARAIQATEVRLEILHARFPRGVSARQRRTRAVGIAEILGVGVPRLAPARTGMLQGGCGALRGRLGTRSFALRPVGSVAALDAGRPLRVVPCGASVRAPAGRLALSVGPDVLTPYHLRLRSPAAVAGTASPGSVARGERGRDPAGVVLDRGSRQRNAQSGIALRVDRPAWLVLGEGYNAGWRASCDGRDLGTPTVMDGYAMGWRVTPGCRSAEARFAPDRLVLAGYVVSAPSLLAALALLLLGRRRRAQVGAGTSLAATPLREAGAPRRWRIAPALAVASAAAVLAGGLLALRTAPLVALGVWWVLWRGVGARPLFGLAGGLLLAAPAVQLAFEAVNRGGYAPRYAIEQQATHWIVAAALVCLVAAIARTLSAARLRPEAERAD